MLEGSNVFGANTTPALSNNTPSSPMDDSLELLEKTIKNVNILAELNNLVGTEKDEKTHKTFITLSAMENVYHGHETVEKFSYTLKSLGVRPTNCRTYVYLILLLVGKEVFRNFIIEKGLRKEFYSVGRVAENLKQQVGGVELAKYFDLEKLNSEQFASKYFYKVCIANGMIAKDSRAY